MSGLDVLVVESTPGAARREVEALEAAGHRVHRCHEPGGDGFPCRAVTHHECPLDDGVDVGLLVRHRVTPRPTDREQGVGCLIRAGIPLVEDGPAVLDPYEDHLDGRVSGDVVAECAAAADRADDRIRASIMGRIARLLEAAGIAAGDVAVGLARRGRDLRVELHGPPAPRPVQNALAVRVLDAVASVERPRGQVDVSYRAVS